MTSCVYNDGTIYCYRSSPLVSLSLGGLMPLSNLALACLCLLPPQSQRPVDSSSKLSLDLYGCEVVEQAR